jgi:hypothetical protein
MAMPSASPVSVAQAGSSSAAAGSLTTRGKPERRRRARRGQAAAGEVELALALHLPQVRKDCAMSHIGRALAPDEVVMWRPSAATPSSHVDSPAVVA